MYRNKGRSDHEKEPSRHFPHQVVVAALFLLVLLAIIFFTSGAKAQAANTVVVTVVNSEGIPQSGATIAQANGMTRITDGEGRASVPSVNGGEILHASRTYGLNSSDPCSSSPEGSDGVSATVPDPPPAQLTITVPAVDLAPFQPQPADRERGLVGLINQQRASEGIAPIYISTTLTDAADRYVRAFPVYFSGVTNAQAHCAVYGPTTRIKDRGFPLTGSWQIGENISWASSAKAAFQDWMASPGHRAAMLNPVFNAVGIASDDSKWIIDLATADASRPGFARAQMTSDAGDPSLADGPNLIDEEEPGDNSRLRDPHLQMKVTTQRRKVKIAVDVATGARAHGDLRLQLVRGDRRRLLRLDRDLRARAELGPGRWRVSLKYISHSRDWLSSSIGRRIKVAAAVK